MLSDVARDFISSIFLFFVAALRTSGLKLRRAATTCDQYVSHVAHYFVATGLMVDNMLIRTERLRLMLSGYSREDAVGRPQRLIIIIPVTFGVVLVYIVIVAEEYGAGSLLYRALLAAMALGYGLSLRPSEYLVVSRPVDTARFVNTSMSFFQWAGSSVFVCVCDIASYLPGPPVLFLTFLDFVKNDARGKGGPRAIAANPDLLGQFCCVRALYEFCQACPPVRGVSMFSSAPMTMTDALINKLLKRVATRMGLDPSRLLPHGIRVAGPVQLASFPDSVQMTQGAWTSVPGLLAYARGSTAHAVKVAAAMHDPNVLPVEQMLLSYNLPAAVDHDDL
jgi:hypothetical protein